MFLKVAKLTTFCLSLILKKTDDFELPEDTPWAIQDETVITKRILPISVTTQY
jgi:hypothetical protein